MCLCQVGGHLGFGHRVPDPPLDLLTRDADPSRYGCKVVGDCWKGCSLVNKKPLTFGPGPGLQ